VSASCATGADVRPLLSAGRRVLVDGHPICDACGRAIALVAPERWRHGKRRRSPVTLAAMPTYEAFRARFPWAAATGESAWRDGVARLRQYESALATRRRTALKAGDNPYLELFELLNAPGGSPLVDLAERRRELATIFAWAVPSEPALDLIAGYGPLVEGGAGSGYWSALLRARGVDVVAYDVRPPRRAWTEVRRAASVDAARRHRERALLLCWPPFDDDAASYAALRAYRGDVVIHVGEQGEGATGSVRFHRELALNWTRTDEIELPHWPRLRDSVAVYRRNALRLPHAERDRCFECRRFIATGAIGRCDACFRRRPPALALRAGRHRVEYPRDVVDAMPAALRKAFERSPSRIR
jgi:hypothetical protein